jgi:hypothetical protein
MGPWIAVSYYICFFVTGDGSNSILLQLFGETWRVLFSSPHGSQALDG